MKSPVVKLSNQRGFTLVELMVATAITGILLIVIMSFMTNSIVQISRDSARSDLLRDAQIGLDVITHDIRLSSNSYAAASLLDENAPGGYEVWESSSTTLVLGTAALNTDDDIIFADELHYTSLKNNNVYFVNDRTLYKRTLAAADAANTETTTCPASLASETCPTDTILTRNVNRFALRYYDGNSDEVDPDDARSVEVTLELATTRYGQPIEAMYTTRTVFRNQ